MPSLKLIQCQKDYYGCAAFDNRADAQIIADMLEALEEVAKAERLFASTITTSTKIQVLISAKALRLVKAAIAKAKGE